MSSPRPPLRFATLADTGGVRVTEVLCSAPRAPLGGEESADLSRLVLPTGGVFSCRVRRTAHVMEPGSALLLRPDEPYRFGHPAAGGDTCLVVALAPGLWEEAAGPGAPEAGRLPLGVREQLATLSFRRAVRDLAHDPDAVREAALIRVAEVLGACARPDGNPGGRVPLLHRRLARTAAAFVAEHHAEPIPRLLDAAAAAAGCSPYHLARVFRSVQGVTLHGFRERLRVASALRALAEGADDLASLATSLGYASHSHLTGRLRRVTGSTPSAVRDLLHGGGGGRRP
ncbi:helix-turn-helix transcriptional regulator [Nocardiopsis sp. FR6]|uniref:helix-turn-helix transcriptional regulator n=1 Tax=Nocardiopsis sp. FR6 TaxID=2605986 RepID=UPI001359E7FB|nr:AraC family transcriptional regulator [Nocardiopsis sp. FR6]